MRTIFLDMDGVLCNFVGGFCALHGKSADEVFPPGQQGNYEFHDSLGMTRDQLWRSIDAVGEDHWANMQPYPWALELYEHCKSVAPTIILSTPSLHHSSLSGKCRWLQKYFGSRFRDYLLGPRKEECARPDTVLIDDFETNCEKFAARGGKAIVFPRPWNGLWQLDDPVGHIVRELAKHWSDK